VKIKTLKFTITASVAALAVMLVPSIAAAGKADRNRDGIPDKWERKHGLSLKVNQRNRDQDADGLRNLAEFRSATDPNEVDSDQDGVDDNDEDRDDDGVDNGNEQREGTLPNDRNTDNDRLPDGREDADRDGLSNLGEDVSANDPIDQDTDNDTTGDGDEQAGWITAYDPATGELTIEGFDGLIVTALVDDSTRVACDDEDTEESTHDEDGDDDRRSLSSVRSDDDAPGSDDDGPGDEDDGDLEDGDDNRVCPQDLLVVGARIHEAELVDPNASPLVWQEIEVLVPDLEDDTEVEESIGTIESFEAGILTITLTAGGTLTGTVDSSTEIECGSLYDEEAPEGICGTEDLLPGTLVHEAELVGGRYDDVELLR
jgi:hypothetical protein